MTRFKNLLIILVLALAVFDLADKFLYKGEAFARIRCFFNDKACVIKNSKTSFLFSNLPSAKYSAVTQNNQNQILSKQDQATQAQLMEEISPESQEYIFYLKDGVVIKGVKESEDEDTIVVKQNFGYSGKMIRKVNKADIEKIEAKDQSQENITLNEIKVKEQFKDFKFFRKKIYSFFTDQDYFKITKCVESLNVFSSEFNATFDTLTEGGKLNMHCCVVIFSNPDMYRDFAKKNLGYSMASVGFYSPKDNCFYMYNFFEEKSYKAAYEHVQNERERIRKLKEENKKYIDTDFKTYQRNLSDIEKYDSQLSTYLNTLTFSLKENNLTVLRHEAAHQLVHNFNVDKLGNFDIWLNEGLARFCETPIIGEINRDDLNMVKKAFENKNYISLRELFSYSQDAKFYNLSDERVGLAYAQSWITFYYLMRLESRREFFKFMQAVNECNRILNVNERIKLFEANLGISIEELEKRIMEFVKKK